MDATKSNPRAASVRIESEKASGYKGQRVHDLRRGKQPAYVNGDLTHLNRVLIEPPTPGVISKICTERRKQRDTQRAMKSGTNVAYVGMITFGIEAQAIFKALDDDAQDAAYLEVGRAVADRLNTTLEGLVVHNDETAPHAHFTLPAYDLDGQPLTKSVKHATLLAVQDDLAEIMSRHAPGIERGQPRRLRIEAGATVAETMNRSVKQLHEDLPAEIAAKQLELSQASERVAEMRGRVEKLEEKVGLTEKEAKRLLTYRNRLAERIAQQDAARIEAERLTQIAREETAKAVQDRDNAKSEGEAAQIKAAGLVSSAQVLAAEITQDTISQDDAGKIWAANPTGLRAGFPEMRPAVFAVAAAMTEKKRMTERAAADQKAAADVLEKANALHKTLKGTLALLRMTLTRVSRFLSNEDRADVDKTIKQAERLILPPKKPTDDSGPDDFTM